jgi:hypothetical protein
MSNSTWQDFWIGVRRRVEADPELKRLEARRDAVLRSAGAGSPTYRRAEHAYRTRYEIIREQARFAQTAAEIDEERAAAVMFVGFSWWFARGGAMLPAVLLGVMFAIELAFLPVYPRDTLLEWIMQGATLVLSGLGLIAAIGTVVPLVRVRRRQTIDTPST